jgi:acyl carrier protein
MDEHEQKIRELISRVCDVPVDIPADANLYLDLGVASVHALQLLAELEDGFNVSIPDEEFVEATSVSKLVPLMHELTVASAAEPLDA